MGWMKVKIYSWLWRIFIIQAVFNIKNKIIYLMRKNGLFHLFYFLKYLSLKLWPHTHNCTSPVIHIGPISITHIQWYFQFEFILNRAKHCRQSLAKYKDKYETLKYDVRTIHYASTQARLDELFVKFRENSDKKETRSVWWLRDDMVHWKVQ